MEVDVRKEFNRSSQNRDYGLVQVLIWSVQNGNVTIVNSVQIVSCVLKVQDVILVRHPRFTLVLLNAQRVGNVMDVLHVKYNVHLFLKNIL